VLLELVLALLNEVSRFLFSYNLCSFGVSCSSFSHLFIECCSFGFQHFRERHAGVRIWDTGRKLLVGVDVFESSRLFLWHFLGHLGWGYNDDRDRCRLFDWLWLWLIGLLFGVFLLQCHQLPNLLLLTRRLLLVLLPADFFELADLGGLLLRQCSLLLCFLFPESFLFSREACFLQFQLCFEGQLLYGESLLARLKFGFFGVEFSVGLCRFFACVFVHLACLNSPAEHLLLLVDLLLGVV